MKISEDNIPDLIREGKDREVVPILYKKVLPLVEKYIVARKGNKEDAFDVFQDALMLFYKQVIKRTFNQKYKVYGYLFRICINLWINKIRKDKRIDWTENLPEMTEDFPEVKEDLLIRRDENIVKQVFAGIGEKCIELLTFTIYENLSLKEIMEKMGFPSLASVKMQHKRCKHKLIKEVEKRPQLAEMLKEL